MLIRNNISGKSISWFGSGGNIATLVTIKTYDELRVFINKYGQENFHILGNCSNMLIDDDGINIGLKLKLNKLEQNNGKVYAESGILTTQFVRFCINNQIGGLEFIETIPGTIGGLLKMNAGAYGLEMKDVVETVKIMDLTGEISEIPVSQMKYSYRHSNLQTDQIILGATFRGKKQNTDEIKQSLKKMQQKRSSTQPLAIKTLGSTFTNLRNINLTAQQLNALLANNITIQENSDAKHTTYNLFVGQILENCGLKGYTIGGARFSHKHANFIENFNQATTKDFLDLVNHAKKIAYEKFQLQLQLEVKICSDK